MGVSSRSQCRASGIHAPQPNLPPDSRKRGFPQDRGECFLPTLQKLLQAVGKMFKKTEHFDPPCHVSLIRPGACACRAPPNFQRAAGQIPPCDQGRQLAFSTDDPLEIHARRSCPDLGAVTERLSVGVGGPFCPRVFSSVAAAFRGGNLWTAFQLWRTVQLTLKHFYDFMLL